METLNIGEKTAIVERANGCERARRGEVSHRRLHTRGGEVLVTKPECDTTSLESVEGVE